jgi:hypothetical protein
MHQKAAYLKHISFPDESTSCTTQLSTRDPLK